MFLQFKLLSLNNNSIQTLPVINHLSLLIKLAFLNQNHSEDPDVDAHITEVVVVVVLDLWVQVLQVPQAVQMAQVVQMVQVAQVVSELLPKNTRLLNEEEEEGVTEEEEDEEEEVVIEEDEAEVDTFIQVMHIHTNTLEDQLEDPLEDPLEDKLGDQLEHQ